MKLLPKEDVVKNKWKQLLLGWCIWENHGRILKGDIGIKYCDRCWAAAEEILGENFKPRFCTGYILMLSIFDNNPSFISDKIRNNREKFIKEWVGKEIKKRPALIYCLIGKQKTKL